MRKTRFPQAAGNIDQSIAYGYFAFGVIACILAGVSGSPAIIVVALLTLVLGLLTLALQGYLLVPNTIVPAIRDLNPMSVMLWAFVLRMVTSIVFSWMMVSAFGHPYFGFNDDFAYDEVGKAVATYGSSLVSGTRHPGYPILLGILHWISAPFGGYHFLLPRILNAGIGSVLAALVLQVAQRFSMTRQRQKLLAFCCIFFPDYLYYSSLTLRDIIIAYLWMLALGALVSMRPLYFRLAVLLALVLTLSTLRFYYAVLLALLAVGAVVLRIRERWPTKLWLAAMLMTLFVLGLRFGGQEVTPVDEPVTMVEDVDSYVARYRAHSFNNPSQGGAGEFSGLQLLSMRVPGLLRPAVLSAMHYLSPIPFWRIGGLAGDPFSLLRLGTGAMWFVLSLTSLACAYRLLNSKVISRDAILILTAIAIPVIASGITAFNIRYRLPAVGPVFLLTFICFNWRVDYRRFRMASGWFLGVLLVWEVWRTLKIF